MDNDYPQLTFTMTAGRRPDLFRRTMDSFLGCCLDQDIICRWLVSDDRTEPDDLWALREEYPFLTIHSSPRPGQPASLNDLFALVETEWALHWEDDWETVRSGNFIREAFDIAFSDERIRNVVLRGWDGICVKDGPLEYRGHYLDLHARGGRGKTTDCFWYGYSLNPGLQYLPTVKLLGQYDEAAETRYFDRPAAKLYRELGLLRANPITKYVEHIGEDNPAWEIPA